MKLAHSFETSACTVGVIHLESSTLVFKNRDLPGEFYARGSAPFRVTPDSFALTGIDFGAGRPAGVSIGINKHQICVANTHVATSKGRTYDLLCENLLHHADSQIDIPTIVERFITKNRLQSGKILVASPRWSTLVEVSEDRFAIKEIPGNFVMTNSFDLLPDPVGRSTLREKSSKKRLQVASDWLEEIKDLAHLKSMLRSHIPEQGEDSICNHRADGGGTESSHIIQIKEKTVYWHALEGFPCMNRYQKTRIQ